MGNKTNVLFASFEAVPFIKTGGLGDVAGSLPAYIINDEFDARVVLPLLDTIPQQYRDQMTYVMNFYVPLGWRNVYCGLFTLCKDGVIYYFLDNEYYFKRGKVYGDFDDGERIAFFSKALVETIQHISGDFPVDILHCNDWHTALSPVFLREHYMGIPLYDRIKTVFTIHNLKFQGKYGVKMLGDILGLDGLASSGQLVQEQDDAVNFMQGAVIYSDAVTTVSETYADEICTPQYGEGLDGLFRSRKYKLYGIVNGINYNDYNPETEEGFAANFGPDSLDKKIENKLALQRELNLPQNPDVPLFAMVSRLTTQKGANLVRDLLPELGHSTIQIAILGTGDKQYEDALGGFSVWHSDWCATRIAFNEKLSRRFYAGADVFLMPSEFEPCGLAQMISMRYGTLPLVRETGGLKDTVQGYWDAGENANGFSFKDFDVNGLRNATNLALDLWYNHKDTWRKLQKNAMAMNYGWTESAEKYRQLYKSL